MLSFPFPPWINQELWGESGSVGPDDTFIFLMESICAGCKRMILFRAGEATLDEIVRLSTGSAKEHLEKCESGRKYIEKVKATKKHPESCLWLDEVPREKQFKYLIRCGFITCPTRKMEGTW